MKQNKFYKLYLVRHGQSESNVGGETSDKTTSITKVGQVQSERLAKYLLNNEEIDLIITSPYRRALQTVEEIKKQGYKGPVIIDKLLSERNRGIYSGKPKKEWKNAVKLSGQDDYSFKPPNGENYIDVYNRMKKFWKKLKEYFKKGYKRIVIVSHGACIVNLILVITKLDWKEAYYFGVKNSSISWFLFNKDFNIINFEIGSLKHIIKALEK